MPRSSLTDVHLIPSPDLLYTQNERVDDGTVENIVSRLTVSAVNVSMLACDVLNESSSQPDNTAKPNSSNIYNTQFFLSIYDITSEKPYYCSTALIKRRLHATLRHVPRQQPTTRHTSSAKEPCHSSGP